jgi:hypothetical protein
LTKIGDRAALIARLWAAMETLPDQQPARASKQNDVILRCCDGPRALRSLKKKLGLAVVTAQEERGRVYRITGASA